MQNRSATAPMAACATLGVVLLFACPRGAHTPTVGGADSSAVIHVNSAPFVPPARVMEPPPEARWMVALPDVGLESAPVALAAADGRVYLSTADGAVVALDSGTRRVQWRGSGSTLRSVPRRLVPAERGELLVLGGQDDSVAVLVAATGVVRRRWRAPAFLQSGCGLHGATLFAAADSEPLLLLDSHGAKMGNPSLPWPEFAAAHPLQRQLLLSGNGETCVAALATGPGFAMFDRAGAARTARYAEYVPTPDALVRVRSFGAGSREITARLMSRELAAQDVAVMDGVVYVASAGRSAGAGRIVDRFRASDGRYLGTFEFESRVLRLAASDGCIYVARYEHGVPVLACHRTDKRQ